VPLGGGAVITLTSASINGVGGVAADATNVYWTYWPASGPGGSIMTAAVRVTPANP
jgi:hypothetical protein